MSGPFTTEEAARVAEFRAALRRFLRITERNARTARLTPQRYLLLLMIKGAADHSERSTVTELAERLQLAQSTVTELVRPGRGDRPRRTRALGRRWPDCPPAPDAGGRAQAGRGVHEQRQRAPSAPRGIREPSGTRHGRVVPHQ